MTDAARMWRRRARLSPDDLREMLTRLDDDCERLAIAQPGVVLYACTSGSSLETGGFDRKISALGVTPSVPGAERLLAGPFAPGAGALAQPGEHRA